jgi:integrase
MQALRLVERERTTRLELATLSLGELRALRWEHVDEKAGVVRVRRSWDVIEGETQPKASAGIRHSSVTVSLDRYGHLFEGALDQTRSKIDAWLGAADSNTRVEQLALQGDWARERRRAVLLT